MSAPGAAAHGARPTSIAELRAVAQPPEVRGRRNAEHWTVRDGKVWRGRIFTFDPSPVLEQAAAG